MVLKYFVLALPLLTALALFQQAPSKETMALAIRSILRAAGNTKDIVTGKMVHSKMIVAGLLLDVISNNFLISMYVKCERLDFAHLTFQHIPHANKNMVSWTILIAGYSQLGPQEQALTCFRSMVHGGFLPNEFTYVCVVSTCSSMGLVKVGKEIHARMCRVGQELNTHLKNSLICLYSKSGSMTGAQKLFDEIPSPTVVSWATIISAYCQCGGEAEGLRMFLESRRMGIENNEYIFSSVLFACGNLTDIRTGWQVHCLIVKCGVPTYGYIGTGIIHLYAKGGRLDWADQVFFEIGVPTLTSWVALIGGYAQAGHGRVVLSLFYKLHLTGLRLNEHAFATVLPSCTINEGKQAHSLIYKFGFKLVACIGNALVDMYANCGFMDFAEKVFSELDDWDVVAWNALIAGHIQWGYYIEAVDLLHKMLVEGQCPSMFTYSNILSLFSELSAVEWGRQTHAIVLKSGYDSEVVVAAAMVDMYAKSGKLIEARHVFDQLPSKNLVCWNSMLAGYALHGFEHDAFLLLNQIKRAGFNPDEVTFLAVLSACRHAGLVQEAVFHFNSMMIEYGITPRIDHYSCMVDLYARTGQVRKAYELINHMPMEPDKVIWRSLLAGCKGKTNLDIGIHAAQHILKIDPDDSSAYVMLWNLYADADMWDMTQEISSIMKGRGLKKDPGCSWIEVDKSFHSFFATDTAHSNHGIIYETATRLTSLMADVGYIPPAAASHQSESHILVDAHMFGHST